MAKKKQQDFSRVQLKPGRHLGRRSNITSTKFKSRKIIMPKGKVAKIRSELTILDYIQKIKSSGSSEKDKTEYLLSLSKLIRQNNDTLNMYLSEIFGTVLDFLRHPSDDLRKTALKAITEVIEKTDDLHLYSFSKDVCNAISAIIKNPDPRISPVSYELLDSMLKYHPDLICHNMELLSYLIPSERKHYTRKITNEVITNKYSKIGDINAFGHISAFIKGIVKLLLNSKDDLAKDEEDESGKVTVFKDTDRKSLVLYPGSGLEPFDMQKAIEKKLDLKENPFEEARKLSHVIDVLVKLIPRYFCQVVESESSGDENIFRPEPLQDLRILIQLLCNITELAEQLYDFSECGRICDVVKLDIASFLKEKVFSPQKKRFPFYLQQYTASNVSPSQQDLAVLNVSLCFLYMKFLSSNDSGDDDLDSIQNYLRNFFSYDRTINGSTKSECIPMFMKMINFYRNKSEAPLVIDFILGQLVQVLMKTRLNHPSKKSLINFFFHISLKPEYKFWSGSKPEESWYEWLTSHLKENIKNLDKKLMRMMVNIAKLRQPAFLKHLDFKSLKPLLRHRDEDIQEAAISLLHNMDINHQLLKDVSGLVCLDSFTQEATLKLITMLDVRFGQYPEAEKPYVDYIEFLLNIAIDVHSFVNSKLDDLEDNKYTKEVKSIKHGSPFCVIPSLHWKEHSKLYDECLFYLGNLPPILVNLLFAKIVKQLLTRKPKETIPIPIHCALAILNLDRPDIKYQNHHHSLMLDLNFSCLMTVSVLTHMEENIDDEWYKWNVNKLLDCIPFTTNTAMKIIDLIGQGYYGGEKPDMLVVHHMLRILKVFIERNLINCDYPDTAEAVLKIIEAVVEERCTDKVMKRQKLYVQIYNYLFSQMEM